MNPVFELNDLHVSLQSHHKEIELVRGVSFAVAPGECLGILGESGSGKSMSMKAAMGLLDHGFHVKGSAQFQGEELLGKSAEELRRLRGGKVGIILQNPMTCFDPLYRIGQQIAETFSAHNNWTAEEIHIRSLELLEKMPPFLTGGEMIDSVHRDGAVFAPVPQKFEAGTVNAAGAVGLAAAIRYLQEKGFDYIQKKELELTQRAMEGLGALPYVHILGSKDPANHTGIVSFTIDGVHPHDVSEILSSDGIDVRAGHHCAQPLLEYLGVRSSTRASMMFYNTPEEIDALIESVSTIRRRMGYGE